MASIGHRTGLFDVFRELPPATPEEIATRAGLNERYVREWLGAMVTAGVIDVHPVANWVLLLAEHAAFLTCAAAADNMAVLAHYIAVLGGVEDDIVACFTRGGVSRMRSTCDSRKSWQRTVGSLCCHRWNPTCCRLFLP
jgi:hypothetical protein